MAGLILDPEDVLEIERKGYQTFINTKNGYAYLMREWKIYKSIHRYLLDPPKGLMVDHINGNKLDNRRSNLRLANMGLNVANRPKGAQRQGIREKSKYKGVHKNSACATWTARCAQHYLGSFDTQEEAAKAYDEKALELFGEFANLNFKE